MAATERKERLDTYHLGGGEDRGRKGGEGLAAADQRIFVWASGSWRYTQNGLSGRVTSFGESEKHPYQQKGPQLHVGSQLRTSMRDTTPAVTEMVSPPMG